MDTSQSLTPQSSSGIDQARQLFAQEGLPFPPIPAAQAPQLRLLAPWVFGTRTPPSALYDLEWFVQEAAAGQADDYVLLGHAGHGSNSWAIHFYLVQGPLALFAQIGYGGAYMDPDRSAANIKAGFEKAAELIDAVQGAVRAGRLDPSRRLLVVASDFTGSRWTWLRLEDAGSQDPTWQPSADGFRDALLVIQRL